jgi:hypothetical protein
MFAYATGGLSNGLQGALALMMESGLVLGVAVAIYFALRGGRERKGN